MAIKAVINRNFPQVSKYTLDIPALGILTVLTVSGIEEELDTVELPDRTVHTGGRTKPIEFEITLPLGETLQMSAMEGWFDACKDPVVNILHKLDGTLSIFRQSSALTLPVSYSIFGMFLTKRVLPELDLNNDGEMATVTWTIKADEIRPIT